MCPVGKLEEPARNLSQVVNEQQAGGKIAYRGAVSEYSCFSLDRTVEYPSDVALDWWMTNETVRERLSITDVCVISHALPMPVVDSYERPTVCAKHLFFGEPAIFFPSLMRNGDQWHVMSGAMSDAIFDTFTFALLHDLHYRSAEYQDKIQLVELSPRCFGYRPAIGVYFELTIGLVASALAAVVPEVLALIGNGAFSMVYVAIGAPKGSDNAMPVWSSDMMEISTYGQAAYIKLAATKDVTNAVLKVDVSTHPNIPTPVPTRYAVRDVKSGEATLREALSGLTFFSDARDIKYDPFHALGPPHGPVFAQYLTHSVIAYLMPVQARTALTGPVLHVHDSESGSTMSIVMTQYMDERPHSVFTLVARGWFVPLITGIPYVHGTVTMPLFKGHHVPKHQRGPLWSKPFFDDVIQVQAFSAASVAGMLLTVLPELVALAAKLPEGREMLAIKPFQFPTRCTDAPPTYRVVFTKGVLFFKPNCGKGAYKYTSITSGNLSSNINRVLKASCEISRRLAAVKD